MSKKAIVFHVFAAIFVLAFFIVSRMPAAIAVNQLRPMLPFVRLGDVSGTLWQGSVSNVGFRYNTVNMVLGYTQWQVRPWSLLGGKLSLHLKAENGKQTLDGNVQVGLGKTLQVTDAEIVAPAALLAQFYPIPGSIEGQFEVTLEELEVGAAGLLALQGAGVYRDARYTLAEPLELGTYAARFSMEKDVIRADLSDLDANVAMSGFATYDQKARTYDVDVKLLPRAAANPVIAQGLSQVFQQTPDGSFQVRRSGQM